MLHSGRAFALALLALLSSVASADTVPAFTSEATGITYSHGYGYLTDLTYPPDFEHFKWANPQAPVGGTLRLPRMGTYDTFNVFTDLGRDVAGMSSINPNNFFYYDSLMERGEDERSSQYGRLAEGIALAEDLSWFAYKLRENAYWHDGTPITPDDVVFTFDEMKKKGPAWIRVQLIDVAYAEKIGPWEVRLVMKDATRPNPIVPRTFSALAIVPKHYWEKRDLSEDMIEPPLGSGPYKISEYRLGKSVTYERNEDYWGWDVPVNRGRYNFQRIKYDYFRDDQILLESVRGGLIDLMEDDEPKNWFVEYNFPAREQGLFKTEVFETSRPIQLEWPIVWNLRKKRFADIRVREALWLLFDFEFLDRAMYFNFYQRGRSMFQGASNMEATGLPSPLEVELLEPFRATLPERVFTEAYQPPKNDGYGIDRKHVERAIELFAEAGWVQRDGKLVNADTGDVFQISFVLVSHRLTRGLLPYIQQLNKVGIETTVRVPEVSNWVHRIRQRQFDATHRNLGTFRVIGQLLRNRYHSMSADTHSSANHGGIKNPAIDFLSDLLMTVNDPGLYEAAVKSVDRVIMWNFYFVPISVLPGVPIVYWDKFGRLDTGPLERVPWADTWWYDADLARRVDAAIGQ